MILQISASQVARITGVNHQWLASFFFFLAVLGFELRALHLLGGNSIA
jgi:hypothetical protein